MSWTDNQFGALPPMPRHRGRLCGTQFVLLLTGLLLFVGCSSFSSTETEANARSRFASYDRVAILSHLPRPEEEYFIPFYMNAFPNQVLVERRDFEDVLGEQDFRPDRLDPETRVQLMKVYGVEGIVYPNFSEVGESEQFALKIIDTETGEIVAAVLVTPQKSWVGSVASKRDMIKRGVDALEGEKNRIITHALTASDE